MYVVSFSKSNIIFLFFTLSWINTGICMKVLLFICVQWTTLHRYCFSSLTFSITPKTNMHLIIRELRQCIWYLFVQTCGLKLDTTLGVKIKQILKNRLLYIKRYYQNICVFPLHLRGPIQFYSASLSLLTARSDVNGWPYLVLWLAGTYYHWE